MHMFSDDFLNRSALVVCSWLFTLLPSTSADYPYRPGHLGIGGLGPLSRQYGTALDHVEEVEVVLANGTITRASNTLYPDLFFVRPRNSFSFLPFLGCPLASFADPIES
jgi:hypothetical protein